MQNKSNVGYGILFVAFVLVVIYIIVSARSTPAEPRTYDELNCMQAPEKPGCEKTAVERDCGAGSTDPLCYPDNTGKGA